MIFLTKQEVYLLYNHQEIYYENFGMKFAISSVFLFRVSEIVCYIILFRELSQHNDEMERNNIISRDVNRTRRRINLLSIYAQISGFVAENIYIVVIILWRVAGQAIPESDRSREIFAVLFVVQFAFVSTIPILASTELRNKFFSMLIR